MDKKVFKINRSLICTFALILTLSLLAGCTPPTRSTTVKEAPVSTPEAVDYGYEREVDVASYTGLDYDEWSLELPVQSGKRHTLLIYMNGSDLESDTAAGTDDLRELERSGVDESLVNVVIFTGGANRWHKSEIPSGECAISVLKGGSVERVATVGQRDMGNAGTLASFIKLGLRCFPAENTSLILWDHGGGSIAGYGADENFNMSTLTLLEMEYAFEKAGLAENRLEMLGFDACLMATVEMAVVAADYADYLVASEGLEPGDGWDYRAVRALSEENVTGKSLGIALCNAFADYYGRNNTEELTLSVIKTSEAEGVMGSLGRLAERCIESLEGGERSLLRSYRQGAKTFGEGTPLDEDCDMIDISDFVRILSEKYPEEAQQVSDALSRAVIYSVYNSEDELGGLSVYHLYGERRQKNYSLEVYKALGMSDSYTEYLEAFAKTLGPSRANSQPASAPHEMDISGEYVPLFISAQPEGGTIYVSPAKINGEQAELVVYCADGTDAETVLGYRKRDGYVIQKGYDELENGDSVTLYRNPTGDKWVEGKTFTFRLGSFVERR